MVLTNTNPSGARVKFDLPTSLSSTLSSLRFGNLSLILLITSTPIPYPPDEASGCIAGRHFRCNDVTGKDDIASTADRVALTSVLTSSRITRDERFGHKFFERVCTNVPFGEFKCLTNPAVHSDVYEYSSKLLSVSLELEMKPTNSVNAHLTVG